MYFFFCLYISAKEILSMSFTSWSKATSFLGHYLKENTDLTDHRGDPSYKDWDEELVAFDQLVQDMDGLSFQDIFNQRKRYLREQKKREKERKNRK